MFVQRRGDTVDRPARLVLAVVVAVVVPVLTFALAACRSSSAAEPAGSARTVRLGYLANLTHAVPILAAADGAFTQELGRTKLETLVFNAGPAAVEALLSGAIDLTYLGPGPAINAYAKSHGEAVRLIAGGASGGAALVVRPGITSVDQLRGATIASPQLGNTQDIALRTFLAEHGLRTDTTGGHDVTVVAQANAQSLDQFKRGRLDGAWLPEPWASRLVVEAGAHELVDERTLWPGGDFVTTTLLVSTRFLTAHPQTVEAILRAHVATVQHLAADPRAAGAQLNAQLTQLTGKPLAEGVLVRALGRVRFGWDPYPASLRASAEHAVTAGVARSVPDLNGIYDLRLLNRVLRDAGQPPVSADGLGEDST